MATDRERITRLEANQQNTESDVADIGSQFRQFRNVEFQEFRGEVLGLIQGMDKKMSKMSGFFGGMMFCVSGLWAVVVLAFNWLVKSGGNPH